MSDLTDTVIHGPFLLAALLAVAAGVVSFASPCVVPLVPGYLSYLTGLVGVEAADGESVRPEARARWRVIGATGLFVVGFSVVFIAESMLVLGLAGAFIRNQSLLIQVSGAVTIVMGLILAGVIPFLQGEWRPQLRRFGRAQGRPQGRILGAPILGAAFGTGWLACTSPVLAGILGLTYATEWNGFALRGLVLVTLYCVGLGIPFLLLAVGFGWAGTALGVLRRHARGIQLAGAAALVVIGIMMLTGTWGAVLAPLQNTVLWL